MAALLMTAVAGCGRTALPEPRPTRPPEPAARPPAGASAPAGATTLADFIDRDLAADRAFPWSAGRRLAWSDFQGRPPAGGLEGAMTAYTLYYAWKCRGAAFEFRAVAGFRRRDSWVKPVILNDPEQRRTALAHEQTHFDLTELHARRMRRHFAGLPAPCRMRDGEIESVARRFIREEKAEQRRYDAETGNGVLDDPQRGWTADLAERLAALGRYAP